MKWIIFSTRSFAIFYEIRLAFQKIVLFDHLKHIWNIDGQIICGENMFDIVDSIMSADGLAPLVASTSAVTIYIFIYIYMGLALDA